MVASLIHDLDSNALKYQNPVKKFSLGFRDLIECLWRFRRKIYKKILSQHCHISYAVTSEGPLCLKVFYDSVCGFVGGGGVVQKLLPLAVNVL